MKQITVGILAHVDAGKTTCVESILYNAGSIRKMGRVDHQDAFLDYNSQERNRGITIYSKQTYYQQDNTIVYVIDTPGHVDFSSEMERTLQVLDLAIVLINGQDGVQSHTETIWQCLKHYHIPTLVFVNKMDISYLSKEQLMQDLKTRCDNNCIDFTTEARFDELAMISEERLEEYMESQYIKDSSIQKSVLQRECFPCFFGSALKNEGIDTLMDAICRYSFEKEYPEEFGAKVYKITTDEQSNRLTHIKITGGTLRAKQILGDDKIDQIRLYSGKSFTLVEQANAGMVCTLKGCVNTQAGQGFGFEKDSEPPLLHAYMNYQLLLPDGCDVVQMVHHLRNIAKEDPQLEVHFDEHTQHIHLRLMGAIQIEVLTQQIYSRTGVHVHFGTGKVVLMETITEPIIGIGHFEPLRHYAEVHLQMEPLPRGSGLVFHSDCSTDSLAINWQRLILTHLQQKQHKGVLTGSPVTDIKITLLAGRAHQKHTEGGDFRQATYRAVRNGLKRTTSLLLEPYYRFTLQLDASSLSKALFDLETKHASVEVSDLANGDMCIKGRGPVRLLTNYQNEVIAFTRGKGKFQCELDGYYPSEDQEELIRSIGYDSERDLANPTGSVFCAHGSGFYVPYDEVEQYKHIELKTEHNTNASTSSVKYTVSEEELKRVAAMAGGRNKKEEKAYKPKEEIKYKSPFASKQLPECILVDGYNMIYDWKSLQDLSHHNIDTARARLIDIMSSYQAMRNCKLILVFDAYRIREQMGREFDNGNITIVYTKQNQTADSYIEQAIRTLSKNYRILVATSDGLEQLTALQQGAMRISARELELLVKGKNLLDA